MNNKILLVDDSKTASMLFKMSLDGLGDYEFLSANSHHEAEKLALEEKPFLIVLDYNMPEKTGTELARDLQKKGVHCHYVLATANTQSAVIEEAKSLGISVIVEKPISSEKISEMLDKIL